MLRNLAVEVELRLDEVPGGASHREPSLAAAGKGEESRGHGGIVPLRNQNTRLAVPHRFDDPAVPGGHHRETGGLSLHHDVRDAFRVPALRRDRRLQEQVRVRHLLANAGVVGRAQELDLALQTQLPAQASERLVGLAFAHDHQAQVVALPNQGRQRCEGMAVALLLDHATDHQDRHRLIRGSPGAIHEGELPQIGAAVDDPNAPWIHAGVHQPPLEVPRHADHLIRRVEQDPVEAVVVREVHLQTRVASPEADHQGDAEAMFQQQHRGSGPAEVGVNQIGPVPIPEVVRRLRRQARLGEVAGSQPHQIFRREAVEVLGPVAEDDVADLVSDTCEQLVDEGLAPGQVCAELALEDGEPLSSRLRSHRCSPGRESRPRPTESQSLSIWARQS